jgi:hypothetical protein
MLISPKDALGHTWGVHFGDIGLSANLIYPMEKSGYRKFLGEQMAGRLSA